MEKLKQFITNLLSFERLIPSIAFILAFLTTVAYIRAREYDDAILLLGITLIAFSWASP
jgi:hypothetical protein